MNVFANLEHALHVPWVVLSAVFAALLILFAGLRVRSALAGADAGIVPDEASASATCSRSWSSSSWISPR